MLPSIPTSMQGEPPATPRRRILAGFERGQTGQLRRMLAEMIGTFTLTTVNAGGSWWRASIPA